MQFNIGDIVKVKEGNSGISEYFLGEAIFRGYSRDVGYIVLERLALVLA